MTAPATCPTCGRHAAWPRRFCGGCRAVLSHRCAACGFANELDDAWCGGCGGALAAQADPAEAAPPKASGRPAPARPPQALPPLPPPRPPVAAGAALAARLLEANRRVAAPRPSPAAQDQDQLDALFAGEP